MRKSFIKGFSVAGVVGALLLANLLPLTTFKASAIIEETGQTSSSTTFEQTESTTEPLPADKDIDEYITEKRTAWFNAGVGQNPETSWDAFSGYDETTNTYHHPVWLGTYFVGVSISETCGGGGNDAILIGDVNQILGGSDIDASCITFHYEIRYRLVTVTFPEPTEEELEHITEINLNVTPPKAGAKVVIQDETDIWDSQVPQIDVTVQDGAKYHLWGDEELNYAYWLKSKDEYEPFAGVLEAGQTYYVEIWLQINDGVSAVFDRDNLTLKVNGVDTPFELSEFGGEDGIAVRIAVTPEEEQPVEEESASSVVAPDSGAFTEVSSAAPALSGAFAFVLLTVLGFTFTKRNR